MPLELRALGPDDREWVAELLAERWGAPLVVSRGRAHRADRLPGFAARRGGAVVGLVTYRIESDECEVVTLDALEPRSGIGSALVDAAREAAAAAGCRRLWLVTTNDNAGAIEFYGRRGFALVAVHEGAVAASRRLKPEIPRFGHGGVEICDELEFEIGLGD